MASEKHLYPLVSVDVALFSIKDDHLHLLLVRRAMEPELKKWALPGAVLKPGIDADLEATALRALRDKISVDVPHVEQVEAFSGKDRDPRGWSISVLFYALLPGHRVDALIKSKVEAVEWTAVDALPSKLAFDHAKHIDAALRVLRQRVEDQNLPLHLMRDEFTLTTLQRTCEAVLGKRLDKSMFRRRLKGSHDVVEVPDKFVTGPQRPAQLYRVREGFRF